MDMQYKTFNVETKAIDREAGIYEGMVSTESVDREKDILLANGAQIENYLKNPVVLFGHDYRSPESVVAKALDIKKMRGKGVKLIWQFIQRGLSRSADLVRDLWDGGYLNAMSVGFIPIEVEDRTDEDGNPLPRGRLYKKWEFLEGSIVTIPMNQDALRLGLESLQAKGYNPEEIAEIVGGLMEDKSTIPYKNTGKADEGEPWRKPVLADFTDGTFADISDGEKRRIAAHFTWAADMPPMSFGDLKLPHHRGVKSGIGPIVWRGVAGAMGRLFQAATDIPEGDKKSVYNHLIKHYAEFEKEPPDFREYTEAEVREIFSELQGESLDPDSTVGEPAGDPVEVEEVTPAEPPIDQPSLDESEADEEALAEALENLVDVLKENLTS